MQVAKASLLHRISSHSFSSPAYPAPATATAVVCASIGAARQLLLADSEGHALCDIVFAFQRGALHGAIKVEVSVARCMSQSIASACRGASEEGGDAHTTLRPSPAQMPNRNHTGPAW